MQKKERISSYAVCLLLAALLLGGCTADVGRARGIVTVADDENSARQQTSENGTDKTEEKESKDEAAQEREAAEPDDSTDPAEVTIQEQVLLDQNGIVVTAQEYVSDSIWGDGISVLLENNSPKDITVGCNALIVNDYMITDLFVSEIAAGKKANDTIYLSSSELKAAGIDTVGKIEIYFHVYDSSTYETLFDPDCVTIQTSAYADMDTTPNDAGTELYNENGVRIVGKTVDENSFWGTAVLLYCENTSGRNVGISVDDLSVNGYMMEPLFATTVYDGKKAIDDITIFSNELEENGIESIEEIELKFHIYDADSYNTIADSEPITFAVQ